MSRIHSGRKGRSGSHRPYPLTKPEWVTAEPEETREQAVRLAKSGLSPAQVGATLRDSFGVPSIRTVTGKRMQPLLHEAGIRADLPEDLQALLKRVVHLQRHLTTHPHDNSNRRGLNLMESRIRRLARYYRRRRTLPEDWRYTSARAVLQVE
ncbi:MAG: 30S ribosomal protein S15 [Thermoplasmata archaeon]|nr:30S ribosomal protein S15 [Thermoplasmata archaeon]MCI4341586.1 30S ribosomal protein S15 [Thermoplasmata archaeon]